MYVHVCMYYTYRSETELDCSLDLIDGIALTVQFRPNVLHYQHTQHQL